MFAATLWPLASNNNFIYGGFEVYRDYDGVNGSFGNTGIRATTSDTVSTSVYASVDAGNTTAWCWCSSNRMIAAQTAAIAVTHGVQFHTAKVYQLGVRQSRASPNCRPT